MISLPSSGAGAIALPAQLRRAWHAPRLTPYESMVVLAQSFLGVHLGVPMNLIRMQVSCVVSPGNNCGGGGP